MSKLFTYYLILFRPIFGTKHRYRVQNNGLLLLWLNKLMAQCGWGEFGFDIVDRVVSLVTLNNCFGASPY